MRRQLVATDLAANANLRGRSGWLDLLCSIRIRTGQRLRSRCSDRECVATEQRTCSELASAAAAQGAVYLLLHLEYNLRQYT